LPTNRANLFLKVEVELDEDEQPERIGEEICRHIARMYGVRRAELASVMNSGE
jgi:hypothetical protein